MRAALTPATRSTDSRRAASALAALVLVGLLAPSWVAAPAEAAQPEDDAARIARALDWLAGRRVEGGGFGAYPTNVVEAVAAAGVDPKRWPSESANAWSQLSEYGSDADSRYYSHLRVAFAAGFSGYDPRAVNGVDYVAAARAGHVAGQSGSLRFVNDDAWAILALRSAGVGPQDPQIRDAVWQVQNRRSNDGAWAYEALSKQGDTDVTGMVLVALAAAGEDLSKESRARTFLDSTRDADGGHAATPSGVRSCQSTAWAIHGYRALGTEPAEAVAFLRLLQNPDGGFATGRSEKGVNAPSNAFCTTEAIVALAGLSVPFRTFAPAQVDVPARLVAGELVTLRVAPAFASARWEVGGASTMGTDAGFVFDAPGSYRYHVYAVGPGTHHRASGTISVAASAPTLRVAPLPAETLRGAAVEVDASGSTSPDGAALRLRVDWGDGNVSEVGGLVARHAYTAPGRYQVETRVTTEGGSFAQAPHTVVVVNRPPVLGGVPVHVVADRVSPLSLEVSARDPDGDSVSIAWRAESGSAAWSGTIPRLGLGNHTLLVRASDAFGATTEASVRVEVVNIAPRFLGVDVPAFAKANVSFNVSASAVDDDGPQPSVAWRVIGLGMHSSGTNASFTLPSGDHTLVVVAADIDDASAERRIAIRVDDPATPSNRTEGSGPSGELDTARPAGVANVSASLAEGTLMVAFDAWPENATRVVQWRTDQRAGELVVDSARASLALPDARWAEVTVVVRMGEQWASAQAPRTYAPVERSVAPPRIEVNPSTLFAGTPAAFRLATEEPASRFEVSFGDGAFANLTSGTTLDHTYRAAGAYEVRAVLVTPDGRRAEGTTFVVVLPTPPAEEAPAESLTDESVPTAVRVPAPAEEEPVILSREGAPQAARRVPAPAAAFVVVALALGPALRKRRA